MSAALVDTHAHLDGEEFARDLDEVVARARDNSVTRIISAGQDEETSKAALALSERFAQVCCAVGIHPHRAAGSRTTGWLRSLASHPRVVAIGEIGLDYHYDNSPRQVQKDVLIEQLELANDLDLPVIIHNRESDDDLAAILRKHFSKGRLGVVHCFTGPYDAGALFVDEFGLYLGIGGAVTFSKTQTLHDAAARLPIERLVLETDCPYMTPVPYRGKRNEPAYLGLVCRRLAELRDTSDESISLATTENAYRLFPKLPRA